jgi:hypothetical protein
MRGRVAALIFAITATSLLGTSGQPVVFTEDVVMDAGLEQTTSDVSYVNDPFIEAAQIVYTVSGGTADVLPEPAGYAEFGVQGDLMFIAFYDLPTLERMQKNSTYVHPRRTQLSHFQRKHMQNECETASAGSQNVRELEPETLFTEAVEFTADLFVAFGPTTLNDPRFQVNSIAYSVSTSGTSNPRPESPAGYVKVGIQGNYQYIPFYDPPTLSSTRAARPANKDHSTLYNQLLKSSKTGSSKCALPSNTNVKSGDPVVFSDLVECQNTITMSGTSYLNDLYIIPTQIAYSTLPGGTAAMEPETAEGFLRIGIQGEDKFIAFYAPA